MNTNGSFSRTVIVSGVAIKKPIENVWAELKKRVCARSELHKLMKGYPKLLIQVTQYQGSPIKYEQSVCKRFTPCECDKINKS